MEIIIFERDKEILESLKKQLEDFKTIAQLPKNFFSYNVFDSVSSLKNFLINKDRLVLFFFNEEYLKDADILLELKISFKRSFNIVYSLNPDKENNFSSNFNVDYFLNIDNNSFQVKLFWLLKTFLENNNILNIDLKEDFFKKMIDNYPYYIYWTDLENNVLGYNLNFKRDIMFNKNLFNIVVEEDFPNIDINKLPITFENKVYREDIVLNKFLFPMKNNLMKTVGIFTFIDPIENFKEDHKEKLQIYSQIVNYIDISLFTLDTNFDIKNLNEAAINLLGLPNKYSVLYTSFFSIIKSKEISNYIRYTLEHSDSCFLKEVEIENCSLEKELIFCEVSIKKIYNSKQNIVYYSVTLKDATEEIKKKNNLKFSNIFLNTMNEVSANFFSNFITNSLIQKNIEYFCKKIDAENFFILKYNDIKNIKDIEYYYYKENRTRLTREEEEKIFARRKDIEDYLFSNSYIHINVENDRESKYLDEYIKAMIKFEITDVFILPINIFNKHWGNIALSFRKTDSFFKDMDFSYFIFISNIFGFPIVFLNNSLNENLSDISNKNREIIEKIRTF